MKRSLALALLLCLSSLVGCASPNADFDDWLMPEGMVVTVVFDSTENIGNASAGSEAYAQVRGNTCTVHLPYGMFDVHGDVKHEFQHCAGRFHTVTGKWLPRGTLASDPRVYFTTPRTTQAAPR